MKFIQALTLLFLIEIPDIFPVTSAQNLRQLSVSNQQKRSQTNCKFPLFSCRLYNRFRGTTRQTGFQGTAQANQAYSYGQPSSYHPSYKIPVYAGQGYPGYNQNIMLQSSGSEQSMASAPSAQYATHTQPGTYTAQAYGSSPNTIDVHQVLDQFIRSAGLSPQGDHESQAAHASSFAKAGTSPVFTFKKLFSFPFYLSADPSIADIYGKNWK